MTFSITKWWQRKQKIKEVEQSIGRKLTRKERKELTTMQHWNGNGQHTPTKKRA